MDVTPSIWKTLSFDLRIDMLTQTNIWTAITMLKSTTNGLPESPDCDYNLWVY